MKNTPLSILACVCLIVSAFLCGLYLGRNMSSQNIHTTVLFTQPTKPTEQSNVFPSAPATPNASTNQTAPNSAVPAPGPTVPGKININTADLATLMTLEGIGPVYAQSIIDYRTEHGPFTDIIDITDVPGIGHKRFEAIMDKITVGG